MSEHLPVTIIYRVEEDGKLIPDGFANTIREETFCGTLKKGTKVEVTYEVINDNASYAQLSKVHACIREIAKETGHSFSEIKREIKQKAGLFSAPEKLKSFSICSKEELGSAIEACLSLAEELNMNLHQF